MQTYYIEVIIGKLFKLKFNCNKFNDYRKHKYSRKRYLEVSRVGPSGPKQGAFL